jgi:hypothetical protein
MPTRREAPVLIPPTAAARHFYFGTLRRPQSAALIRSSRSSSGMVVGSTLTGLVPAPTAAAAATAAAVVPAFGVVPSGVMVRALAPPVQVEGHSFVFALAGLHGASARSSSSSGRSVLRVWGSTNTSTSSSSSNYSSFGPWQRGLGGSSAASAVPALQHPAQSVSALQQLTAVVQLNAAPATASSTAPGQVLRAGMQSSSLCGSFSLQDFGKKASIARPTALAALCDARQLRTNSLKQSLKVGTVASICT